MSSCFSPESQLRAMARFEWALTCALEAQGLAEPGSGEVVRHLLDAEFVDVERLKSEAKDDGNIAISFVRQLTAAVKSRDERAARSIHLGATSQDVLDTALVLQMHDGVALLVAASDRLRSGLTTLVREHRGTLITARTWLQAGPPTTFGLKLTGTLSALERHRERLEAASGRALVLQLGGAVGTLAAVGTAGEQIATRVAAALELDEPALPWHTQRDALVEMVEVLANLTGTLAKFARDMALLMQPEVAEVSESASIDRGGSSTMPHKHNPVSCATVIAAHERMPGLVITMLHAMPQEHERGLGVWQAEWETVPEAFRLAAVALQSAAELAEGLEVHGDRMRWNFEALLGVSMAEAVSSALAKTMPRAEANELLRRAATQAVQQRMNLGDVLRSMPEVSMHLSAAEIDRLMEGENYLGSAQRFIARVLGEPDDRH